MTTVVDPLGAHTPVFNRSGITVIPMEGGIVPSGTSTAGVGNNGNVIPALAQTTVAVIKTSMTAEGWKSIVTLSDEFQIGDVVELYLDLNSGTDDFVLFPAIGQSISGQPVSTGTDTVSGRGVGTTITLRKVSSTLWMQAA